MTVVQQQHRLLPKEADHTICGQGVYRGHAVCVLHTDKNCLQAQRMGHLRLEYLVTV